MYSRIKKLRIHKTVSILTMLTMFLVLWGCGGSSSKKQEELGSLKKIYTIIDEQGRKSGTLTLDPMGSAELRDTDGSVIGKFAPAGQAQPTSKASSDETPPEAEKAVPEQ